MKDIKRPHRPPPALQVTVLGSGGGPNEMNTTAFLIRPIALRWATGSVLALDAGVHLGAITNIFERTLQRSTSRPNSPDLGFKRFTKGTVLDDGPFEGFTCPGETPVSNAASLVRLIRTYLITHPHLDHIAGIVANSPSLGPPTDEDPVKIIAGLPSTIKSIKQHIFNNLIWPNLSTEGGGAGFFQYHRLKDGGSAPGGEMSDGSYTEICEGLSVFARSVSHGLCCPEPSKDSDSSQGKAVLRRRNKMEAGLIPRLQTILLSGIDWILERVSRPFTSQRSAMDNVYDSTAYFVKDDLSGTEILVFGDIEPDSRSRNPRNKIVWKDAAAKIKDGTLKAIFMECSWDNSQTELFGHMKPEYVMEELQVLANFVSPHWFNHKPRIMPNGSYPRSNYSTGENSVQPRDTSATLTTPLSDIVNHQTLPKSNGHINNQSTEISKPIRTFDEEIDDNIFSEHRAKPLEGITIVIIHMKERLDDGPRVQELVGRELHELEEKTGLGCNFIISEAGMSLEF